MRILISGGRVIDPASDTDHIADVVVDAGRIVSVTRQDSVPVSGFDRIIDASGCWVVPGFVDMHVHFRDPGQEYKEDIFTGCESAAAGGFTTVCCMPNTMPVIDTPDKVRYVLEKAENACGVRVLQSAAITVGQRGKELTDFASLQKAGAAAVSEDGHSVADIKLMREALRTAAGLGIPVLDHTEQPELRDAGSVHRGAAAGLTGIPGIPEQAEEAIAIRDMLLAQETGGAVHLQHISTSGSLDLIRFAKKRGINVTAETAPHYFTLTDEDIIAGGGNKEIYHRCLSPKGVTVDTHRKMNPPLRSSADRQAVIEALMDGTLDAIATDHAPHSAEEKSRDFLKAPFGVIGLETSFAVSKTVLVDENGMTPSRLIELMSVKPAEILGCGGGTLAPGCRADIAVLDPDKEWTVPASGFRSKAENTAFAGMNVCGAVVMTIAGGRVIFEN